MNVVYPETEDVIVTLTPGDIVCQNETYTNCSATITSEDNYTASITVSNDVGSSTLVTTSFSCECSLIELRHKLFSFLASILYAEADLNPANPRVTAVVNTSLCINNVNMFQVNFLFGVVDSGNCVPAPTNSRNVSFNTTRTAFSPPPTLNAGDIYCFALSLSIGGVSVAGKWISCQDLSHEVPSPHFRGQWKWCSGCPHWPLWDPKACCHCWRCWRECCPHPLHSSSSSSADCVCHKEEKR